jgi:uncharacterized membrane protein YeaQ/YmgE (transglycosylase-associated protein family)
MKSYAQSNVLSNIAIGAIGAVIGGWLMNLIGQGGVGGINLYSFLVALSGAIILIWLIRILQKIILKIT